MNLPYLTEVHWDISDENRIINIKGIYLSKALTCMNSVGRCVIPWEFLGKSVKHTYIFLSKNVSCLRKKMFPIFSCRFNVMVMSQSDVPIFGLLRA